MKTSTKILGTTLIAITALLAIGIISSRIYLNRAIGSDYKNREAVILEANETMSFDIDGFNSITFIGVWEIEIIQGNEYSLEVEGPRNLLNEVELKQTGAKLTIRNDFKTAIGAEDFKLWITVPELENMTITGGADLTMEGFTGSSLGVTLSGAGRIRAFDSKYEMLTVICSGAGQLDFTDAVSINADVTLSGAGEVLLNMGGGELSGILSGMGSIEYEGQISRENIRVSGLGEVSPR